MSLYLLSLLCEQYSTRNAVKAARGWFTARGHLNVPLLIIDHIASVVKRRDSSTFPAAMEEPQSPMRLGHSHRNQAQWWWVQLLRDAAEISLWGVLSQDHP